MTVLCFTGAAGPGSAQRLVGRVQARLQAAHGLGSTGMDLSETGPDLRPAGFAALVAAIEAAPALVVGMPVYQGSYPGLFKHVFDLIRPAALRDKPVLLTAVGGGLRHSLMVEHQLRPLFGFFEAATVPTAVYAQAAELAATPIPAPLEARIDAACAQFAALILRPAARIAS